MPPEAPTARELARRLIARASASGTASNPASAAHAACERLFRGLSLWLGANGAHALFARAITEARSKHPAVHEISAQARSQARLDGLPDSIQKYGTSAVAAGLEAVLEAVLALLRRLLGADIAMRLTEQDAPDDSRDDEIAS